MKLSKFWGLVILLTVAAAGCMPQPATPAPPAAGPTGTLVYGTTAEPSRLNPIVGPEVHTKAAIELAFDPLVAVDDQMALIPALASRWEISADGRQYTFYLRQGVRWHDGQEFTADDVKFTLDTIRDPNVKGTIAKTDYTGIQEITTPDKYTVRITLQAPDASFLSKLSVGIAPKHLLVGQDLLNTDFNRKPVGTGPYRVEEWASGQYIRFKANPDYWGTKPGIDTIVWKFLKDSNILTVQLLSGEVDAAAVPSNDISRVRQDRNLSFFETLGFNTYVGFNNERPLFRDLRVRQALNYGLDKQAVINSILEGQAVPATSEILPNTYYYNPNVKPWPRDLNRARALLAEAGWQPGPDGILQKDGQKFSFKLLTNSGDKVREEIVLFIRQQWRELGVDVEPVFLELNTFINDYVLKSNFDAIFIGSSVNVDPDFLYRRFHTSSIAAGHNFLRYSNPTLDRLLEQGRLEANPEKRREIYFRAQEIIYQDSPSIPIFHPKVVYAFRPQISGVKPSPISLWWNVEEWRLR